MGSPSSQLESDGHRHRGLNGNGLLDVYEDSREPVPARVEDLLSQMTIEEKVGLMFHTPVMVNARTDIGRQEFRAMGIRTVLNPMADEA